MRRKALLASAILVILSLWGASSTLARWTRDTYTSYCCLGIGPGRPVLLDGRTDRTDADGCVAVVNFPFFPRTLRYTDDSGAERVQKVER